MQLSCFYYNLLFYKSLGASMKAMKFCLIWIVLFGVMYAQTDSEPESKKVDSTDMDEKTLPAVRAQAKRERLREHEYANTTTLTAQSLQERQATSLRDVFALDPSISVGGANTTSQKVYIRGLEDRLYSVSIDNASQYGNIFHHQGNITIDPLMLKQISVQKGVPSVYNGAGALAGSISMQTKDARDFLATGEKYGALLGLGGYSNLGYRVNLAGFFATTKTDALLYVNQTNILGFYDGNGNKVTGSSSNNKSMLFKINQNLGRNNKLTLSYSGLNETSTAPFATNLADRMLTLFAHRNWNHTASLGFEHISEQVGALGIKSNLYFNQRSLNLTPLSSLSSSDHSEVNSKDIAFSNVGYNLGFSNQFDFFGLEYGLNYQGIFVADKAAIPNSINKARESGHIYGGFIKTDFMPSTHWILSAQSRYDVFSYMDKNANHHLTNGFSPSISTTYLPLDSLSFRLSYSYLTRGALPGDATLLGEDEVLIQQNLKPEHIHNVEFNTDFSGKIFCARFAVYYSRLENFINSYAHDHSHDGNHNHEGETHTHSGVRSNMSSPMDIFGYEGGTGADYKGFGIYASIARSFPTYKGYLLQDTWELGAVSGTIYNLSLHYEIERFALKFTWLSQFTQRIRYEGYDIYNDEIGFVDKAGYSIHNLYINWEPLNRRLNMRLSINNIFNTFYITQTSPFKNEATMRLSDATVRSAMPNPGIDARFEVSYRF